MRIAIIGAGLAGLTAAYELRGEDRQVDVFEAAGRIGGKLYTVPFNDGPTDMGAEAFLARREDAVEFFHSLGLADQLVTPSGKRSLVYSQGELTNLPAPSVMGIPGNSEVVAHLVSEETCRNIDNEEPFEWEIGGDVSVGQLVAQQFGQDLVDRVVSALLGGVYSCAAEDLGLRATIPKLAAVLDDQAADGKVTLTGAVAEYFQRMKAQAEKNQPAGADKNAQPKAVFNTFRGGYAQVYDTLAEKSGADIYVDTFISAVEKKDDGFWLTGGGQPAQKPYDRVVIATPAPTTARLLAKVAPAASEALSPVKLASSVVVGLKFDSTTDPEGNSLPDNSGILVAADQPGVHAKAFTLSTNKWPHLAERLHGGALVRASFARFGDDSLVRAEEDQLVDYALDDLQSITGFDGRAAGVGEIFTQRWFGGLPRFDATHLATVEAVREELADVAGLEVTGAWAGGVGVPDVIADARAAAARLA